MKQETLGREAQESPGFSRGEKVNWTRMGDGVDSDAVDALIRDAIKALGEVDVP